VANHKAPVATEDSWSPRFVPGRANDTFCVLASLAAQRNSSRNTAIHPGGCEGCIVPLLLYGSEAWGVWHLKSIFIFGAPRWANVAQLFLVRSSLSSCAHGQQSARCSSVAFSTTTSPARNRASCSRAARGGQPRRRGFGFWVRLARAKASISSCSVICFLDIVPGRSREKPTCCMPTAPIHFPKANCHKKNKIILIPNWDSKVFNYDRLR